MTEPTFHALLIGADGYFPNVLNVPLGGEASYSSLQGAVNDVARVQAMLEQRLAGHRLDIRTLTARAGEQGEPIGDSTTWPTADNLRAALDALADRAQPGDQVYIHYSGHGGRVSTAWQGLKGADGVDEALVPIDIGGSDRPDGPPYTRAERYLRDVELAFYLDRLARKVDADGRVVTTTLVLDCCHAGGATRGLGLLRKRSAVARGRTAGSRLATLDRGVLSPGAFTDAQLAAMGEAHERLSASTSRGQPPASTTWLPPAKGYVLLAGCTDLESALECSLEGRPSGGVLTTALLEALAALGDDQTWQTVYNRVLVRVDALVKSQTPQLLGEIGRHVFGVELGPVEHTLIVKAVDAAQRTVTVNGGLALTVTDKTELGIYRPGVTDFSIAAGRVAVATVTRATALESVATLDEDDDPAAIELGAPVIIQATPLRRKVELFVRDDLPPAVAAEQAAALAAVGAVIASDGDGFLERCPPGATPHYQVAVTPSRGFELCDPQGVAFRCLDPIAIDGKGAARAVVAQLRRINRYHTVLGLDEPASPLHDQLAVEVLVPPPDWHDPQPPRSVGGTPLALTGDAYTVANQTWLWLRVTNRQPTIPVNVAVLAFDRLWEISMIVPHPQDLAGKKYETVAGVPRTFPFKMYTQVSEAIDIMRLFATTGDVDFRALTTTRATTRAATGSGATALSRLVDTINGPKIRSRDVVSGRSASAPWTTYDLRMRTRR